LAHVPLAARVVEVIADLGPGTTPRYRYGSGCIVRGRTVLTAAHVVAGAQVVQVRKPDKVLWPVRVDWDFVGGGDGPDLALVDIDDDQLDLAPIELAVVNRDSVAALPVESCHIVGYPWFAERQSPSAIRDTVDAWGHLPVLSGLASGLLTVEVTAAPRALPPERTALEASEWSGMSGAPVVADGCLLGVVSEHAPRAGPSAITAVPLSALELDPRHPGWGPGVGTPRAWWGRLGVVGTRGLRRLPVTRQPFEPAYRATVREIHRRTPQLLGRDRELAKLTDFAAGTAGYLWLTGDAWAGKTALVAEAITTALPQFVDVVSYFMSRREADADSNRFLAAVVPQLAYLLNEDSPVPDLHQFRALWDRAADRAKDLDRKLLLVVDGLDEDLHPRALPSVASLLPAHTGSRAHVLVTSRPYLDPEVPAGHQLRAVSPVSLDASPYATHLAVLARQEIQNLLRGEDQDLAAEVLGMLTAAAGPLAIDDLVALTSDHAQATPAWSRQVNRLVVEKAARSLQPTGPLKERRYQFAHGSLLEQAQTEQSLRVLRHPGYRRRIHQWAEQWQAANWPIPAGQDGTTPRYLLDEYASTVESEPQRFASLTGDLGWVAAVLQTVGVDRALASLEAAHSVGAASVDSTALLAAIRSQASSLRPPQPISQPGYVLRQLCLQAAEFGEGRLAADARARLLAMPDPGWIPLWTTRRASRSLSPELGRHDRWVETVAVLPDGRVVSGGGDEHVRVWDPAVPGASPVDFGFRGNIWAVAVLPDGRVVSGGSDRRVLLWDPAVRGGGTVELGRHDGNVRALAVLPDGRVVSGGGDGRVRIWDPATAGGGPVELGRHDANVIATVVLRDGRIVTGGSNKQVLVWDSATPGVGPVELGRHDGNVRAVADLPDGRVVSGGSDGRLRVWHLVPPKGLFERESYGGKVQAVAVLPDGRVISGHRDGWVRVWDPATSDADPVEFSHGGNVWAVAVLSDERVVSGGSDGWVRIWDPSAPHAMAVEFNHGGNIRAVAVLPDGRVVSGGSDKWVRVWDPLAPNASPIEFGPHHGWASAIAVLPDGRIASGDRDGWVRIWDPSPLRADPIEVHHGGNVRAIVALPDGRIIDGDGNGRVRVWDPAAPDSVPIEVGRHRGWVAAIAVLSDGRVVSGGRDGQAVVWDVTAAREVSRAACSVTAMAVTHTTTNVERLLIAHEGQGVTMWLVRPTAKVVRCK
jgi:WD40 repeat protein